MSAIPTTARKAVKKRQEGQCCRCGAVFTEIHHRQRRREGGHGYANLVGLCGTDHRWAHANPVEARKQGYIISIHDIEPSKVAIKTFMGWMYFTDEGEIEWA